MNVKFYHYFFNKTSRKLFQKKKTLITSVMLNYIENEINIFPCLFLSFSFSRSIDLYLGISILRERSGAHKNLFFTHNSLTLQCWCMDLPNISSKDFSLTLATLGLNGLN